MNKLEYNDMIENSQSSTEYTLNKDVIKGWVTMDEWGYDPADDIYEEDYKEEIDKFRKLKKVLILKQNS